MSSKSVEEAFEKWWHRDDLHNRGLEAAFTAGAKYGAEMRRLAFTQDEEKAANAEAIIALAPFNSKPLPAMVSTVIEAILNGYEAGKERGAKMEREACAQVCEDTVTYSEEHYERDDGPCGWCEGLEKAATAIRQRGEKEEA